MDNDPVLADALRLAAERAIAYRETLDDRPQRPLQSFGAARDAWMAPMPHHGTPARAVVDELAMLAEPGLHAMAGARFFGWVIGASHPVGVAADWLTSAWGQNAGNHLASPAAAAAEAVAERWLLDILGLPPDASVGFVTGATMANFVCLAAARGAVLLRAGWDVEANGLFGAPPIRVLLGDDAHATVFSALQLLGLGHDRVERVATDGQGAMRADALRDVLAAGHGPCIVATQAGQLNTGAFDPFAAIIPAAHKAGAWVHVDGAFGLWARACPSHSSLADGVDRANSWATDGHKWLQTPYECGYAIVRDAAAHRRAMSILTSYLPMVAEGERDPSHYVPELSRRARGFATWAMLRHLGRDGIAAMVAEHCRLARLMAALLSAGPGIAVLNEVVLNQVIVRFGDDDLTQRTIAAVQGDATCFAGGATWRGRRVMRLSVISWPTREADIRRSAAAIIAAWRRVRGH